MAADAALRARLADAIAAYIQSKGELASLSAACEAVRGQQAARAGDGLETDRALAELLTWAELWVADLQTARHPRNTEAWRGLWIALAFLRSGLADEDGLWSSDVQAEWQHMPFRTAEALQEHATRLMAEGKLPAPPGRGQVPTWLVIPTVIIAVALVMGLIVWLLGVVTKHW